MAKSKSIHQTMNEDDPVIIGPGFIGFHVKVCKNRIVPVIQSTAKIQCITQLIHDWKPTAVNLIDQTSQDASLSILPVALQGVFAAASGVRPEITWELNGSFEGIINTVLEAEALRTGKKTEFLDLRGVEFGENTKAHCIAPGWILASTKREHETIFKIAIRVTNLDFGSLDPDGDPVIRINNGKSLSLCCDSVSFLSALSEALSDGPKNEEKK